LTTHHVTSVHRWDGQRFALDTDVLADETPVELALNNEVVTRLLATNDHLEMLCLGHFASEYGLDVAAGIITVDDGGGSSPRVNLSLPGQQPPPPRPGVVTSSCGACNASSLGDMMSIVSTPVRLLTGIDLEGVLHHLSTLSTRQPLFELTGGVHAAALLYLGEDDRLLICEDIGRHNAVDKVFGAHVRSPHANSVPSALLLSGRCGWDIVAKAARMGVPVVASIGAASQLAAQVARANGITLVTFGRKGGATVIGSVQGRFEAKD
jgi:FdhD protein